MKIRNFKLEASELSRALHHRRKNPANLPGFSKITRQNTAVQKNPANKTRQNTTDDSKNQIAPQGENLSFYFMFLTFYVQKCLGNDHKILSASSKIKKIACGAPGDANRWKNLKNIKIFWKSLKKINNKKQTRPIKPTRHTKQNKTPDPPNQLNKARRNARSDWITVTRSFHACRSAHVGLAGLPKGSQKIAV